jgi:hypothetical protein
VPSAGCGAPDWCGECSCPPQPEVPFGLGNTCDAETPCPVFDSENRAASHCGEDSRCEECITDEHCPADRPTCGLIAGAELHQCFECQANGDCPAERPRCDAPIQDAITYGNCHGCLSNADCSVGICLNEVCVPQCQSGLGCSGAALLTCSAEQRCEPPACATDADCGTMGTCSGQSCVRKTCAAAADCGDAGFCVQGQCYDAPGQCIELLPVP